jgi:hypothetical protein
MRFSVNHVVVPVVPVAKCVPVTTVAAQLGHSRKSLTLDTYSHVLVEQ